MNILFYIYSSIDPKRGGIHRVTDVLMNSLGSSHNIFCLSVKKTNNDNNKSHFYLPNESELSSKENLLFAKKIQEDYKIDYIINQEAISPYTSQFIAKCKNPNVKLLSVVHNSISSIYGMNGKIPFGFQNYMPAFILRGINAALKAYFKYKYKSIWLEVLNKSSRMIMLDEAYINELITFLDCKKEKNKIIAIPNPITIKTDGVKEEEKESKVLFVGRLSYEKNIITLLRIWELVYQQEKNWTLDIVGEGEERKKIEEFIKKRKLQNVVFHGKQDPTSYYNHSKIFCLTSLFEGMPLVILEALAFGCVPIAFDSFKSITSLIDNNKDGYIIPSYDIQNYATKLLSLMKSEDKRECFKSKGKDKAILFSLEKINTMWNNLFLELQSANK